jgi:hypothetical protein
MMVLWLLMLRALGIELRGHVDDPVWRRFWDFTFAASSAALTMFLGVALGNVIRGVPLGAERVFFEPLWTDFRPFGRTGIRGIAQKYPDDNGNKPVTISGGAISEMVSTDGIELPTPRSSVVAANPPL